MLQKINLLHILSTLQIGGAEKQVVTLLKNLDKKKYRVILCCLHFGGPLEKEIEDEDIEIIYLRFRFRYFLAAMYKLIRFLRNENIHIVHTHLYSDHLWGRIAAWIAGVPVIIATEHGRGLWKKQRHLIFERVANRFTDLRIAVSEDIRRIRIEREHTSPEKVVTVHNAIDPDAFDVADYVRVNKKRELGFDDDELIIGTVARLDPDKALDDLLDVTVLVMEAIPNVRLLLVGSGHLMQYLQSRASVLGIKDRVIFTGVRTDIAELLNIMDVYVNSSIREGISVSLLEAMAAKRAVVATDVGGNREIINSKECGIIVLPQDAKGLAGAIVSLLKDKERRDEIGLKARERIQTCFSSKNQANKIEGIYEGLLRAKSGNIYERKK